MFLRQEPSPLSPLLCHRASLLCQPTVLLLGVIPNNQPDPEPLPSCCLLLIYLSFVIHTNLHVLDFLLAFFSFHALDKAIEQNIPVFHISFPFWSQPTKYRPMISSKFNIQSLGYSLPLTSFIFLPPSVNWRLSVWLFALQCYREVWAFFSKYCGFWQIPLTFSFFK